MAGEGDHEEEIKHEEVPQEGAKKRKDRTRGGFRE
jgi:hypothetical protein